MHPSYPAGWIPFPLPPDPIQHAFSPGEPSGLFLAIAPLAGVAILLMAAARVGYVDVIPPLSRERGTKVTNTREGFQLELQDQAASDAAASPGIIDIYTADAGRVGIDAVVPSPVAAEMVEVAGGLGLLAASSFSPIQMGRLRCKPRCRLTPLRPRSRQPSVMTVTSRSR
jgi:hypothetical protein